MADVARLAGVSHQTVSRVIDRRLVGRTRPRGGPADRAPRRRLAVFCANDQMALGLLRALHEAGRGVPDGPRGVSVVGFDDIPEAAYIIPPLTTVRQDFQAVGQRAIEVLRAAIGQVPAPERLIGAELVVRASTAAPVERKQ